MKKNKKDKYSFAKTLRNNLFLIKICVKECPWHILYFCFCALISEIIMFFEWVFGIKFVLSCVENNEPLSKPITFLCIMLVVHTVNAFLGGMCWHNVWQKAQPRMQKAMKNILYDKARTLDLECYDNPDYYNNYVLSINEANNMVNRAMQLLQKSIESLTTIVLYGGFYLFADKVSVLFVFASFLMTFIFSKKFNKISFKQRVENNAVERKRDYIHRVHYLSDYAKELRLNTEYIKVLDKNFEDTNNQLISINKKYSKPKFFFSLLKSYISNDFIIQVLFLIYLVYRAAVMHAIAYSDVVVLFNSANRLKRSLKTVAELLPYIQETSLYVDKTNEFLSYEPKIKSGDRKIESGNVQLTADNIGFSYSEDKSIINGISLDINQGDKIAIVGYNGAGKTTLVKLLMRLYDVTDGEIKLNTHNIKEYNIDDYRNSFGTCFQDFKIFACALKENVSLDTENTDNDRIKSALSDAGFDERLKTLDKGLDTQLTTEFDENGVNLSGGESQKVAIARAFYKDSPIIILDEPSAALDPISEYELNNSILNVGKDKTIIFISHRLSTTRNADKIIMLENGQIIESGNHEELLRLDKKYAEMWKVQSQQYINI